VTSSSVGRKRSKCLGRRIDLRAPVMLILALSSPLAAQNEDDPSAGTSVRIYGGHVLDEDAAGKEDLDSILVDSGDGWMADVAASDLTGVVSPASTEYRYDDGTPEAFTLITGAHEQEYAQRFRLPRAGMVTSVTACFGRQPDDDNPDVAFVFVFYRDAGGRPGSPLAAYSATVSGLARGRGTCGVIDRGDVTSQRLDGGDVWLGVQWPNSSGKGFAEDRNGPGGTRNFWRYRSSSQSPWSSWNTETVATAYFMRLGVDHEATPHARRPGGPGEERHLGLGRIRIAVVLQSRQRRSVDQGPRRLLAQRLSLGLRRARHDSGVQPSGHRARRHNVEARQRAGCDCVHQGRYAGIQVFAVAGAVLACRGLPFC